MATYVEGKDVILSIYDETAAAYEPVACLTTNSIAFTREVTESEANKCDLDPTQTPAGASYEVTADGHIIKSTDTDYGTKYNDSKLYDAFWEKKRVDWKIEGGNDARYGNGILTAYSEEAPTEGVATFSLSISGSAKPTDTEPVGL